MFPQQKSHILLTFQSEPAIVFVKHTEEAKAEITVYHPARLIHGLSAANCLLLNLLLAASPYAAFFSL